MLTDLKTILNMAEQGRYAIPAFNVYNLETLMGVVEAAEELNAPVIIQSYSRLFTEGTAFYIAPAVIAAAVRSHVPICFHIDHGASEVESTLALRYGCTGVMIDASALPFAENVELTRQVVETAGYAGVPVEGELGHVGTVNDIGADGNMAMDEFTDVLEAKTFVEATGVAALAVLVGTAHGRYKKPPKIDTGRIVDIKNATGIPLVLHGGSGIPDGEIRSAITAGIRKVNFGTDVCYAFLDAVFETPRNIYAVDLFMKNAIKSVKAFAMEKIKLLGADEKA